MQIVEAKKGVFTGPTKALKNMPISDTEALEVEQEKAGTIRGLISRLHKKTDLRFETETTDTGILVWRLK